MMELSSGFWGAEKTVLLAISCKVAGLPSVVQTG